LEARHDLIPLKPLSEEPLHFDWPITPSLTLKEAQAHMDSGGNIGVRLRPDMLIMTVNRVPAQGGEASLRRLERDLEMSLSRGPLVLAGDYVRHFYFRKPATSKIRAVLFGISGLRFETAIGMTLASGSVNPSRREHCRCEILQDVFTDPPQFPTALLHRMERQGYSYRSRKPTKTHGELAADLKRESMFHNDADWFLTMKIYHASSDGAVRDAFVEWSMSDPRYAGQGERIEALWECLNDDLNDTSTGGARFGGGVRRGRRATFQGRNH
jgi:hypothetical protein